MKLDISARVTPQVPTIIFHHMKKVLLKERKKGNKSNYGVLDKIYILTKAIHR